MTPTPLLIQHTPWVKEGFKSGGLYEQRIAIVGYSHWNGDRDGKDRESFTCDVVGECIEGTLPRTPFFSSIRDYFDFEDHATFWPKVMFFNYLPRCIGGPDERYATGTPAEHAEAKERFFRLAGEYKPDKVIVFTPKAWYCRELELATFEQKFKFDTSDLGDAALTNPCGSYSVKAHVFTAFGFRHPQGATKVHMRKAVARAMAFDRESAEML